MRARGVTGPEVGCYVGEHLSRDPKVYSLQLCPSGKRTGHWCDSGGQSSTISTPFRMKISDSSVCLPTRQGWLLKCLLYRNLEEIHQELKETQNLLVHREKMAALGELCNSVAHELKNPLVSIGGFARRLYRAPDEASEKRYSQSIMVK
jgi:phosphoglycerate-specific signal transduction histidine kinase